MKKRKFRFQVTFDLDELTCVPFVNGVLFCKLRLSDGGSFTAQSSREQVEENSVQWRQKFEFPCKMTANVTTGVLEPCVLRVSVRKETKGGKTYSKLGFADVNLAEFAGSGSTCRRFLLEGYDTKHTRQDNSTLKVTIGMHLLSGDPCFKTPPVASAVGAAVEEPLQPALRGESPCANSSAAVNAASATAGASSALSRGFSSLRLARAATPRPSVLPLALVNSSQSPLPSPEDGYFTLPSRGPSHCSRQLSRVSSERSRVSGYSTEHSGSSSTSDLVPGPASPLHKAAAITASASTPWIASQPHGAAPARGRNRLPPRPPPPASVRRRPPEAAERPESRVDETRVDAVDVVDQILQMQDFTAKSTSEEDGLTLFVGRDGTWELRGHQIANGISPGPYEPVVISRNGDAR
ncbi:early estrogen-induced gene 1 protein isoform X1 [Lampetra fluviatilis]